MQNQKEKITTFLWVATEAEEMANYYTTIFKNSRITHTMRWPEGTPAPAGSVVAVSFEVEGREFTALNGANNIPFTAATSFLINCDDQEEIDYYWDKLLQGGKPMACGWLSDKYGVTWQVVPKRLLELNSDPDREKAGRVMQAMMKMVKIDLPTLERAAAGETVDA